MSKLKLSAFILFLSFECLFAQTTNSFPDTGNVGIGTTSPVYSLDMNSANYVLAKFKRSGTGGGAAIILENALGTGSWLFGVGSHNHFGIYKNGESNFGQQFIIQDNGNVGIGTISPEERLHIAGTVTIVENIGEPTASYYSTGNHSLELQNHDAGDVVLSFHRAGYTNAAIKHSPLGGLIFSGSGKAIDNHMFVSKYGKVGIGTTNPDSELAVNGNIHAKEVKVDLVGWPDYVFKKGYNLPTLEEVEMHIKEKGHLINFPSAKEVEENGIELGGMNKLLLEKIEELTLYTIQQQRELEEQKEENKRLEGRLNNLEKLITINKITDKSKQTNDN